MNDRKRLHRGDPARVGPIRDFSKLYGRADSANGTHPAKPVSTDAPRKGGGSPLAEGVELAYSVIDKYIAEGRQTAEGFSSQPYATRATNDNLQEVLERLFRFQTEMLPLWIETLAPQRRAESRHYGSIDRGSLGPTRPGVNRTSAELRPQVTGFAGLERSRFEQASVERYQLGSRRSSGPD
jgi:hypothetical protein